MPGTLSGAALLGPRQVGKTTLALALAEELPSIYLDLESEADRNRLSEPLLYLADHADELVILDEIHRAPGLFEVLRGMIEVKRSLAPKLERGMRSALSDIRPERSFVVYPGEERYRLGGSTEAIGLPELCEEVAGGG